MNLEVGAEYHSKTGAVFDKGLSTIQRLGLSLRGAWDVFYFVEQSNSSKAWTIVVSQATKNN